MKLEISFGLCILSVSFAPSAKSQDTTLAMQVEIRRTAYGVPHIRAQNFKAAGYALGYVQMEDYGDVVPLALLRARGELARVFGHDSIESDLRNRPNWLDAAQSFPLLDRDTRDVYEGFAAGVNTYMRLHPDEFAGMQPDFSGVDALTTDMELPDPRGLRRVLQRLGALPARTRDANPDEGSNAWAFAPSRTKSGKAILLRNPHLDWDAGYYEAQLTIPDVIDFYGDFRIGGPFQTIGGFNARLGWATTNNAPDPDEVYALPADPARPDHVLFDGASIPLRHEPLTLTFRNGDAFGEETRELLTTSIGPVVHRANGRVYVWRYGGAHDWRLGQMWLRMMRARNLAQWQDAMRMLAKPSSNFTYADADGNISYVWYGQVPSLPQTSGGDTAAVDAASSANIWTRLVPFDSLPQLLNPPGGYIHNENDPFHFTNLNAVMPANRFPPSFPQPALGLRSQLALQLISGKDKLSLDDVITRKHTMRMLLADRVKDDLLRAVNAANPAGNLADAANLLSKWDNTVAPASRGSVLFELWWLRYTQGSRTDLFREPWRADAPTRTPTGLASPERAAAAFAWAVEETVKRYGSIDVAWGDVHRVRRGDVDLPVGGCSGALGCFRVLWYRPTEDGKLAASGGDGWILAVEFGKVPRAYSVLAYGESRKPASPHFSDQAAMFAQGRLKPVPFVEADVKRAAVRTYHPGLEPAASNR